jgi:hypothetical protein
MRDLPHRHPAHLPVRSFLERPQARPASGRPFKLDQHKHNARGNPLFSSS